MSRPEAQASPIMIGMHVCMAREWNRAGSISSALDTEPGVIRRRSASAGDHFHRLPLLGSRAMMGNCPDVARCGNRRGGSESAPDRTSSVASSCQC